MKVRIVVQERDPKLTSVDPRRADQRPWVATAVSVPEGLVISLAYGSTAAIAEHLLRRRKQLQPDGLDGQDVEITKVEVRPFANAEAEDAKVYLGIAKAIQADVDRIVAETPMVEDARRVCEDCGAILTPFPSGARAPGQRVWRCPWITSQHVRVVRDTPHEVVLNCSRPKPSRNVSPVRPGFK